MSSVIPFLDESEAAFSQEDVIRARTMVIRLIFRFVLNDSTKFEICFVDYGKFEQSDISVRIASNEG